MLFVKAWESRYVTRVCVAFGSHAVVTALAAWSVRTEFFMILGMRTPS